MFTTENQPVSQRLFWPRSSEVMDEFAEVVAQPQTVMTDLIKKYLDQTKTAKEL